MQTLLVYVAAAVAEIAGCFSFWMVLRQQRSSLWLLAGTASLLLFGWLLTRSDSSYAGRAYAAYGGIYILCSLIWLWWVENRTPDRWDGIGAMLSLIGAAIIVVAPHGR